MIIQENCNIEELIKLVSYDKENELLFDWNIYTDENLKKLSNILGELSKLNKSLKIIIGFNKVNEVKLANIDNYVNKNLELRITIDHVTYSYEEFKKMDNQLNDLLKDVHDTMSPLEKYNCIYDKVRKYKEYKVVEQPQLENKSDFFKKLREIIDNKYQSCNLKYILENEFMDCLGFSILLQTLLNKVGIESTDFGFEVYDNNGTYFGGHARTILNLDDDKYNIHGIFISDATWDSHNDENNLKYSLLPISSMREPIYSICNERLLFDVNNEAEFLNNLHTLKKTPGVYNLTEKVIKMINAIDRKESSKLMKLDSDDLLVELKKYILSRTNKEINNFDAIRRNK